MGEVVNLNQARKARDKARAKRQAADNRIAFGRSKSERQIADKARERDAARLDGHKRDDPKPD